MFKADLQLMNHMERFNWMDSMAQVYGFFLACFVESAKLNRTLLLIDEVYALEIEFTEI